MKHVRLLGLAAAAWLLLACGGQESAPEAEAAAQAPHVVAVEVRMKGEVFHLELAADALTRFRGLGGRQWIAPNSGMLFAFESARPRTFVMRDCPIAIDVAYLDAEGIVVTTHTMVPEVPRQKDETNSQYESRLSGYPSRGPAQFVVEVAGGRLAEIGLEPGDPVVFDRDAVLQELR